MIGLLDYTLQTSTSVNLTVPNLEIMKLATYYKTEENIFCRLISLNEQELSAYDKIYIFSEQPSRPKLPVQFLRANNVIMGGSAFTETDYIPFDNEIIDYTIPRPAIYKEYFKQKYNDGIKTKIIEHILDDSYYRRFAGKNQLPLPPVIPKKRVFIYDTNFFKEGWQDIIKNIAERKPSSIYFIHPIICNSLGQYLELRKTQKIARANEIILNFNIPLDEVDYMLKKYKNFFLGDINSTSNVYLTLGNTFVSNLQYYKDIIYKLNLLYAFWSRKIPIKIKYINPKSWANDPLYHLSNAITIWSKNFELDRTINQKIALKSKKLTIEEQERNQVLKFYPSATDLFEQSFQQLIVRGYWRL